jgi:uncharacterized protein YecT (DUF1311 family)
VRYKRVGVVVLLIALSVTVQGGEEASAADDPCDLKAVNTLDVQACAAARHAVADKKMNDLYSKLMRMLATSQPSKERLRDSQRAWLVFRDKACLYKVGKREESGTSYTQKLLDCEIAVTKKRIEDLKGYVACIEAENPSECPD